MSPSSNSREEKRTLIVIGRFPPPNDGQAIATARFVENLKGTYEIIPINTMIAASASVVAKVRSYRKSGQKLRSALESHPDALVIWQSISPETVGHFRDLMTIFPALKDHNTIAVAHWGKFASVFTNRLTSLTASHNITALNKVVFTDPSLAEACDPWLSPRHRAVIPNSVDPEIAATLHDMEHSLAERPHKPVRLLFLSNMIREKGYMDVLEAVFLLNQKGVEVHATFAGAWQNESDKMEFEALIQDRNASESVRNVGIVSDRSHVKHLFLTSDIFVLPSYLRESQPLAIAEALSTGTPSIVADDGGMPAMIENGRAGRVIPAQNPEAICIAVEELSDPAIWQECSRKARQIYSSRFDVASVRDKWIRLIEEVYQNPKTSE